jgi:uncharacterized membrane-anchored protein
MVQETREDEEDVLVEKLNNSLLLFLGLLTVFTSLVMLTYSATLAFYAQQFTTSFLYTLVFAAVLFVAGAVMLRFWRMRRRRRGGKGAQVLPISKTRPRISLFLFILLLFASLNSVPSANAASKIQKWYSPGGESGFGVYAGVDDSWPTETTKIVHLKVTLIEKNSTFDHVDIKWTKVAISTPASAMSSGNIPETASFRNTGEYYERKVEFWVPPDTLDRGENASLSIMWTISVDIVDNVEWEHSVYTGSNSDNPMIIELYRPTLSTTELTIIGIAIMTAVASSIGYYVLKRRSRISSQLQYP